MGGRLIVSLGSRRVAWRGLGDPGVAVHAGEPGSCLVEALTDLPRPAEVVVGSVAGENVTRDLREACRKAWSLVPRELVATAKARGVCNAYAEPAGLGIDRWAAMIAARHAHDGAVLVADCGTAVTVDYVAEDGRHVGGLIAPGIGIMRAALASGTRLAPTSRLAPTPPLLGTDTELAITGGTLAAVAGLLAYVAEKTRARYGEPKAILVTGGDAVVVAPRLGKGWSHAPDLVLDGLELLAEEPT
ncbi:MAG: type III pantothenate kinase [Gammaproteobacteria bacterium]